LPRGRSPQLTVPPRRSDWPSILSTRSAVFVLFRQHHDPVGERYCRCSPATVGPNRKAHSGRAATALGRKTNTRVTPRTPLVGSWKLDLELSHCGRMTGHPKVTELLPGCRPSAQNHSSQPRNPSFPIRRTLTAPVGQQVDNSPHRFAKDPQWRLLIGVLL
jgi:hypothetical protein